MATFSEHIHSGKPVIVDFFADWCGPCKMMKLILEEYKQKAGDNVTILKVNIDKNPAVASAYNIGSIPTILLFKHGAVQWRQAGVVPRTELESIVNKFL